MPGTLIVSFDCEDKWGIADHLTNDDHTVFTDDALEVTYRKILDILAAYTVPATFAFVGAFTLAPNEYQAMAADFRRLDELIPKWMNGFNAALRDGRRQGWFGKKCMRAVENYGVHEIGSHGFSHVPWNGGFADAQALELELRLLRGLPSMGQQSVTTFVYPRGLVGHLDLLTKYGFVAFQGGRQSRGRMFNLLSEFNPWTKSDPIATPSTPIEVPSGRFLNWRSGLRKLVPPKITLSRWRHVCRHAAETDGVAHLWTHPENFVTADGMFDLFAEAIDILIEEKNRSEMKVLTESQYANAVRFESTPRRP